MKEQEIIQWFKEHSNEKKEFTLKRLTVEKIDFLIDNLEGQAEYWKKFKKKLQKDTKEGKQNV
jgi:hypothetical protein